MTELQIAGLVGTVFAYIGLGLGVRWLLQHVPAWHTWPGVILHEAFGAVLLLGCSGAYVAVFRPPFDGLLVAFGLGVVTALVLLGQRALEPPKEEPKREWPGITPNGNLSNGAIRRIENAIAEVVRAQQAHEVLGTRLDQELDSLEVALGMAWMQLTDLRNMRPQASVEELRVRVRERVAQRATGGEG